MNRYIKWFLSGVLILLVVFLGGFFIPAEWIVSESLIMKASKEEIHAYVSNLQKWQLWTPWTKEKDSTLTYDYQGPQSGVGAKSLWTSKQMGSGSIEIIESDEAQGIKYSLFIDMGMQSHLMGQIAYKEVADGIEVTWSDRGDSGNNLVKRWMSLMINTMLGKELRQGLDKLKSLVEVEAQ